MLPIKFRLNPTSGLRGDIVWSISRWPPWQPSWISERDAFSNSKSLSDPNASHQVYAQSDFPFGTRRGLKISRWPLWRPSWISKRNDFSHSESLYCSVAPMKNFTVWEGMSFKDFQDGRHGDHFGYRNGMILTILNRHVAPMPSTKFAVNLT